MNVESGWVHDLLTYDIHILFINQVAICTGCDVLRPWAAIIVGAITAFSFNFTAWFIAKMKIDDPVDAIAGK